MAPPCPLLLLVKAEGSKCYPCSVSGSTQSSSAGDESLSVNCPVPVLRQFPSTPYNAALTTSVGGVGSSSGVVKNSGTVTGHTNTAFRERTALHPCRAPPKHPNFYAMSAPGAPCPQCPRSRAGVEFIPSLTGGPEVPPGLAVHTLWCPVLYSSRSLKK